MQRISSLMGKCRTLSGVRLLAARVCCCANGAADVGVWGGAAPCMASGGDADWELSMELLPMRVGRRCAERGVKPP